MWVRLIFAVGFLCALTSPAAKLPKWMAACGNILGGDTVREFAVRQAAPYLVPAKLRQAVQLLAGQAMGSSGTLRSLGSLIGTLSDGTLPVQTSLVDVLFRLGPNAFPGQDKVLAATREKIIFDLALEKYADLNAYPLYEKFFERPVAAQVFLVELLDSCQFTEERRAWLVSKIQGADPMVIEAIRDVIDRNASLRGRGDVL